MPGLVLLPTPLAPNTLALGQLLVDPLDPSSTSFTSTSTPALRKPEIQAQYRDVVTHDHEGHFISSISGDLSTLDSHLLMVQADEAEYSSVTSPSASFDALRQDPSARRFLRKMGQQNQPLYYVVGIQKLRNPTFKRAVLQDGTVAEAKNASDPKIRLPSHMRRDSGMDVEQSEAVVGVELMKVMCHVGSPNEPHALSDIGYSWSYHSAKADHDDQLSIGFGSPLSGAELRALAGISSDADLTDDSHFDEPESDGFGGF
ncbi:hypothetical protein BU24DRAFT_496225 [Aaosphaeria arxii CBS 175.79]|uniref:Uncharacterized protein n=1 Tax=Aaosphaeria arxii CBS 175.79 TaxID=1450172 RepID=A0A6A5XE14_9PLEO|nr:uncharacterized protein BU24DRAFT_496225 [Aaosphaeria arxii CBS 175.79]KAF2011103.1 hypothetical protein BU24DRAFT_496225 [Aaosphaeria arxii CBS 175.79]